MTERNRSEPAREHDDDAFFIDLNHPDAAKTSRTIRREDLRGR